MGRVVAGERLAAFSGNCPTTRHLAPESNLRIQGWSMKSKIYGTMALASAMVLSAGMTFAQSDTGAKQDMKNAGSETKDAAKDTGHGVKKGTEKGYHATKHGTKKAYHATKRGTKKAVHATAHGTEHVAHKVEGKTEPTPQ